MTFGDFLVQKNIISSNLLLESKQDAENAGISLEEALLKNKVSEDAIIQAKSELFKIPVKRITSNINIPFTVLKQIPEESVRYYKFVPLGMKDGVMEVGVVNPDDMEMREALQFLSSKIDLPFKIFLITMGDFESVLKNYKGLGGETVKILDELESVLSEKLVPKEILEKEQKIVEDTPVTKMVTVILRHAIDGRASDIHIEPMYSQLKVRFRVDGILHTSLSLPIKVHESVVTRIKILTSMKLDEKRKPQDGRFEVTINNQRIDFRVSTFPSFYGEKVVIRILDSSMGLKNLENIGLVGRNLELVKEALVRPYGMVLLTGPTGSGKTTTLYSMLNLIDREKKNAVSLEDPIEYNLEGVNQSQVRPEIDYTFASGLRSILRQDPDVIMVGEMRDKETAQLAVQAALTGHLVFSTLHTNNSIGVVSRLIDMGVDPFLIPSTLILAIAQRLVRTLCPESRKKLKVAGPLKGTLLKELEGFPAAIKEKIKLPAEIYQSEPSPSCPRGTRGRTGVFEILQMTPELEKIILTNPSETAIMEEAQRQGMITMHQDGMLKVFAGKTGMEQLKEEI